MLGVQCSTCIRTCANRDRKNTARWNSRNNAAWERLKTSRIALQTHRSNREQLNLYRLREARLVKNRWSWANCTLSLGRRRKRWDFGIEVGFCLKKNQEGNSNFLREGNSLLRGRKIFFSACLKNHSWESTLYTTKRSLNATIFGTFHWIIFGRDQLNNCWKFHENTGRTDGMKLFATLKTQMPLSGSYCHNPAVRIVRFAASTAFPPCIKKNIKRWEGKNT